MQLHALESLDYTESNLNATRRDAKFLLQTDNRKTLFLLSTDPFPAHASTHSPDMSKGSMRRLSMLKQRGQTDIVVVSDGRNDCARMEIRKVFGREFCEECDCLELWIVYEDEPCLGRDPRNPKRKLAWSGTDVEVLSVSLPSGIKGQRKSVNRDVLCRVSTNYNRSYKGVKNKALEEIPRPTAKDKATMLGKSVTDDCMFSRDRVQKDVDLKGHPLFWCEWKPTSLYIELRRDFQVTDVVDLTVGSGAAALGALSNKVHYFGVCVNHHHLVWVRRIVQCQSLTKCVSQMK